MGSLSNHPYIVTVYASAFTSEHRPCIVMDLFEHGHYLTKMKQEGPLALQELLSLGIRMSGALEAAHRQGIIHGDVKPQNIFRSDFGFPALGDFGIATFGGGWSGRVLSLSIDYAAPELIEKGTGAVSPLSDQFSLGATLYTLATGRRPFRTSTEETPSQTLTRMLSQSPPRLPDRFPPALVAAVHNTMARNKRDRYPDLATFAAALSHVERQLGLQPTDIVLGARDRSTARATDPSGASVSVDSTRESVTVARPTTEPHELPEPAPDNGKTRRRRWLAPAIAVAAVGIVAASAFFLTRNGDQGGTTTTQETTTTQAPTTTQTPTTTQVVQVRPPEPTAQPTLSAEHESLNVSWSPPPNTGGAEITGYNVRYCDTTTGCDTDDDWALHDHTGTDTTTTITDLTNGTTYRIQVNATNSAGHSDWSQPTEATPRRPIWNYSAVSAGNLHSCGIRSDGLTEGPVICWGTGDAGQTEAPAGTYKAVSVGNRHSCAISTDDTLACWGSDDDGQVSGTPEGTYKAVSAGNRHSCAISTDDTLACWGLNEDGQADPPAGTYKAVDAAWQHSCAISTDDTLACWGLNEDGQADPPNGTYKAVDAGWRHSCAIRTTGYIDCWGNDEDRQADPPNGTFTSISAGWKHSCAISTDGTLACWGLNHEGQTTTPDGTYAHVTAGWSHSCAIRTDGILTCWGWNEHLQAKPPGGVYLG